MGNCCGSESHEVEDHELKAKQNRKGEKGHTLGGEAPALEGDASREARLNAIEKRRQEAENRGVKEGGGKLSKQLAEQNKQTGHSIPVRDSRDDQLTWD
ncbi:uncharacterized protein B0P05DRAFT_565314 [Gilbertella persicaria]|uniref:uncharacterized protein n=1 Tax=Gilbertella persicaria TaxID=101096 RepID=UPI00221F527D|nr:uncharacterized protein B0P05DRAFT_565314 [Gilbertella persicaria]KAI8047856.1 hypothetical protein B0P05DRAFT_565314 [Gilbertella persicaria]